MRGQVCVFPQELRASMGTNKVLDWLKEYGGQIASAIVIFSALLAGVSYVVRYEVADIRSDVSSIKSDVSELKAGSLKTNSRIDDLLKDALERAFPIPSPTANKAELEEDFRRANSLMQLASSEKIKLNPQIMTSYGKQVAELTKVPSASDTVWPAAAELINYRSQIVIPDAQRLEQSDLPNCTDREPEPMKVLTATKTRFTASLPTYENCRFTLDSAKDDSKVNQLLLRQGGLPLQFKHCIVVYSGGS